MSASVLERFMAASLEGRLELLQKEPATAAVLKDWCGETAYRELSGLKKDSLHLSVAGERLLFVPGIMGSMLKSKLGGLWWVDLPRGRTKLDGLRLSPGGEKDADAVAGIEPCGIDLSYEAFSRTVATSGRFGYESFPFDWRRLVTSQTAGLQQRIIELYDASRKPVHLVGHSLGGLMIRAALMQHGAELWPLIGKIVFIGTPHYGSPSIAGYLKNHLWGWDEMAVLGMYLSRETFRSMRGALSLLPAPSGVYPGTTPGSVHPCANFDMYKVADWGLELGPGEDEALQETLQAVAQFHHSLKTWHDSLSRDQFSRMLVIAGVGYSSLFRLEFDEKFWGLWKNTKRYTERQEGAPNFEGDGRVSVASAKLDERITIRYVKGRHGSLPNLPDVSRDVLAWLAGEGLMLSDTVAGALASHLASEKPSPTPALEGFNTSDESYERYRDIPESEIAALKERFEQGQLPSVQFARLL